MEILRCDLCKKPLSEGALARGEAKILNQQLICSSCLKHDPTLREQAQNPSAQVSSVHLESEKPQLDISKPHRFLLETGEAFEARLELQKDGSFRLASVETHISSGSGLDHKNRASRASQGIKLPQKHKSSAHLNFPKRSNRWVGGESQPKPSGLEQAKVHTQKASSFWRSPYLLAAALLTLFILPAFSISLYVAIHSQKERNQLQVELETYRQNKKPSEDKQNRQTQNNHGNTNTPEQNFELKNLHEPEQGSLRLSQQAQESLVAYEAELALPVIKKLSSEDYTQRLRGLKDAIRLRAVSAAGYIRFLTTSKDLAERLLAVRALGKLHDQQALTLLENLSQDDPVPEVRLAAQQSLQTIQGEFRSLDLGYYTDEELSRLESLLLFDPKHHEQALNLIEEEKKRRFQASQR